MNYQTAERIDERKVNGVDVDRLFDTIGAIKGKSGNFSITGSDCLPAVVLRVVEVEARQLNGR
jgi:hypothetical protein